MFLVNARDGPRLERSGPGRRAVCIDINIATTPSLSG